jgi:hypothetical protein
VVECIANGRVRCAWRPVQIVVRALPGIVLAARGDVPPFGRLKESDCRFHSPRVEVWGFTMVPSGEHRHWRNARVRSIPRSVTALTNVRDVMRGIAHPLSLSLRRSIAGAKMKSSSVNHTGNTAAVRRLCGSLHSAKERSGSISEMNNGPFDGFPEAPTLLECVASGPPRRSSLHRDRRPGARPSYK